MRTDKEAARHLRLSGKSYKEIIEILEVPRSTLSGWFGKEDWSEKIRDKLSEAARVQHTLRIRTLNKTRGKNLELAYDEARKVATEEFEVLKYNPLFIAGIMLYWGEGTKLGKSVVRLTNTDSEMIRLYVFFVLHVCRIPMERVRAQILIYPDLNDDQCRRYWVAATGLPEENFTKTTTINGRHKTRRLSHGVCLITVSSAYFKAKVLTWISLMPGELMNGAYYESIKPSADIV